LLEIFVYAVQKADYPLTEAMQIRRDEAKPWALRATSLICVLLLALLTFVQVTHVHPVTDGDHCPICVVMHSAAPVAVAAPPVIVASATAPVVVPMLRLVPRLWHYTLFNRPPPAQG